MASENESEKRETSADVADEIRRAVESMGDEMPYTVSAGTMRRVADRIEVAWKRQEKTYLDQIRDAMNMWGHEKHIAEHAQKPAVGNAAAMREALVGIRALIADEPDGTPMIDEMKTTIEAALSAPARNCDLFGGDPKMLNTAWFDWTASPSGHDANGVAKMTFAGWLLVPAAERKGE